MKCASYTFFFRTLAPKLRLKILALLREGPMSATEIARACGEEQSKVSHNLRRLTECNFIVVEKKGKQRIYSLNKKTVLPLLKLVEKHVATFCKNCPRRAKNANYIS